MAVSLAKLTALGPETQVYCTHEYTQANLKFAIACEPGNLATHLRIAQVSALRERGEITLPTTIGLELASNPYLRCTNQQVIDSAENFSGVKPSDAIATFAAVRAWKDEF
jgi:hydroxyacylglutathione hydrolase